MIMSDEYYDISSFTGLNLVYITICIRLYIIQKLVFFLSTSVQYFLTLIEIITLVITI